jgi:ABC-type branched-subunit amino acid transport system permease subunit
VGAHRVLHAAHRAAPAASGPNLKLDGTLAGIVAAGAALAVVPYLHLPAFYESFLYLVLHWIVLATSWNILSGYSGYFSFGHGAFFGAGVYTTAVLAGSCGRCPRRRSSLRSWGWRWVLSCFACVAYAAKSLRC